AKRGQLVHASFDVHARSRRGHATRVADHGDLTRSVIHAIELERNQRKSPAPGDDAVHADGLVVVPGGLVLQLGDVHAASGTTRDEKRAEKREDETRSFQHFGISLWGPDR